MIGGLGGVGGLEGEGSYGFAGVLDEIEVAGLEGEGDRLGQVDAGVFEVSVEEEGDGNEAGCGGVGERAGPLEDGDGAGDRGGGGWVVGLGVQRGQHQREGKAEAANGGPEVHGCDGRSRRSGESYLRNLDCISAGRLFR